MSGRCDGANGRRAMASRRLGGRGDRRLRAWADGRPTRRPCRRDALTPVLTAHPTEARRRTTSSRCDAAAILLARLDDPRLTPSEDADVRRRLREEITLLWRTVGPARGARARSTRCAPRWPSSTRPCSLAPRLYRVLDGALDDRPAAAVDGAAPGGPPADRHAAPTRRAFLDWGCWIGGDRDGNPDVTAETTERDPADPRRPRPAWLRGRGGAADADDRRGRRSRTARSQPRLRDRLARDAEELPETDRRLRRRFPDEPYRQRFGFIAERLRRDARGPDRRGRRADRRATPDAADARSRSSTS